MRTTLFHIPAELAGLPVFGFGWLLLAWVSFAIVLSLWLARTPGGRREIVGYLPFFIIIGAVIAFFLPTLVEPGADGKPLGLPIRGYGVMLMIATVTAVALAAYRAWQVGIDPEVIYSLALVMFIAGIIGARLFYVAEYWQEFSPARTSSLANTFWSILNVPKGGLVVYGSVLFGVPAGVWFCRRRGLPMLAIGDVIAPSMVWGLALGRVGCFLNGCCFGGICLTHDYALTFPADSPPYLQQEQSGWDSGVWLESNDGRVALAYVDPQGPANDAGLKAGDVIAAINGSQVNGATRRAVDEMLDPELQKYPDPMAIAIQTQRLDEARKKLAAGKAFYEVETADGRVLRWNSGKGPPRSVPIHATQLYAAVDAALLTLVLWLYFPFRRRDGEVFALLLTLHPISRFLIEFVRTDEPKYPLTISQWISIAILAAGIALWIYVERQPRGSALPAAAG